MATNDRTERAIVIVGSMALIGYLVLARVEVAWMTNLQADHTYRVVSGVVVAAYLIFQWSVASRRQLDPAAVTRHKLAGALAPLVLYFHASRPGYGYLLLLGITYLTTVFIGLFNRPILNHARALFTVWFVVHVSTAMILVVLGGYHVVIALAYE